MMPWLPVCFPVAPAVCAGTHFSDDLVRCSCDKLSAAPRMILVLCILPPPHAKGYIWLMTCLQHVLHCKPDSDRHLTMFPAQYPVFHYMHPSIFKVLSSTSGGKLATLTRRILNPTASIRTLEISPFSCRKSFRPWVAVNIACILCGCVHFI